MIGYAIAVIAVGITSFALYNKAAHKLRVGDKATVAISQVRMMGGVIDVSRFGIGGDVVVSVTKIGPQANYAEGIISALASGPLPPMQIPPVYFPVTGVKTIERNGKQWQGGT